MHAEFTGRAHAGGHRGRPRRRQLWRTDWLPARLADLNPGKALPMTGPDKLAPEKLASEEQAEVRERVRARYAGAATTAANRAIPFCGESGGGDREAEPRRALHSRPEHGAGPEAALAAR